MEELALLVVGSTRLAETGLEVDDSDPPVLVLDTIGSAAQARVLVLEVPLHPGQRGLPRLSMWVAVRRRCSRLNWELCQPTKDTNPGCDVAWPVLRRGYLPVGPRLLDEAFLMLYQGVPLRFEPVPSIGRRGCSPARYQFSESVSHPPQGGTCRPSSPPLGPRVSLERQALRPVENHVERRWRAASVAHNLAPARSVRSHEPPQQRKWPAKCFEHVALHGTLRAMRVLKFVKGDDLVVNGKVLIALP